jgi:hypothetical protein
MVKTGKTKPAIFSYEERVFAHRRQVPSRPSAASQKDRRAWTGGGDATQKKRRKWQASVGRLSVGRKCGFGLDGDSPDKAQQLPADGGHDLWLLFAGGCQFLVTSVQMPLRFPGYFFYLRGQLQIALPRQQKSTDPGPVLVGPSRFDDHAPQMCIAGLGDGATLDSDAAHEALRDLVRSPGAESARPCARLRGWASPPPLRI